MKKKSASDGLFGREKVLLVDDDRTFRSEFRECFDEYEVIEASSAEEALGVLKRPHEIGLVIMDVRMPGMGGIEALDRIKSLAPEVGIIISTGFSSKDVVLDALRGRANDYIEKPLDIDATRRIIEKAMEARRARIHPGYDSQDLRGKLVRVKNFVQRNCLKKVKLEDAAVIVSLSPKYLSRIFKEETGEGFNEYKLGLKIDQAKSFLRKSGLNVDQIAEKLGYQNTESFIRQFKKIAKLTPTQFRHRKGKP